ncbi:MAG: hypothetical protein P1V97_22185, partial [Planctomycetota bacterium]|nr:hypothetical protein [Planctomycetota bacterium]
GGRDASLQIWSVNPFEQLDGLNGQVGLANSLHFSPDSTKLLAVGFNKVARAWDLGSKKLIAEIKGFPTVLTQGRILEGGEKIVIGDKNGTIWFHDLPKNKKSKEK